MKNPKPTKNPNPKKRTAKKRTPAKRTKRAVKAVRNATARKRPAPRKRSKERRNPRPRPSLIRALIPIADMEALARGAASDIESLSNPSKRIRMRRAPKGKRGKGTRRNPFQHLIIRRRKTR